MGKAARKVYEGPYYISGRVYKVCAYKDGKYAVLFKATREHRYRLIGTFVFRDGECFFEGSCRLASFVMRDLGDLMPNI